MNWIESDMMWTTDRWMIWWEWWMDGWSICGQISEYLNAWKRKKKKEKSITKSIKYVLYTWKYDGMYLINCTNYHNCTYWCSRKHSTPFESDKLNFWYPCCMEQSLRAFVTINLGFLGINWILFLRVIFWDLVKIPENFLEGMTHISYMSL